MTPAPSRPGSPALTAEAVGPFVEARWACARCGGQAAHVRVCPPGAPEPGRKDVPAFLEEVRIAIFFGRHSVTSAPGTSVRPEILAAIADGDAPALYWLDEELAPFWCPSCGLAYCAEDWTTQIIWADDYPGWFEELRGVCPDGHERRIYD